MASSLVAALFATCVLIVAIGVLWFHIVRPILEDFGVIRNGDSVKDFQESPSASPSVMSSEIERTGRTDQANERTNEQFEVNQWIDRVKIDRTKAVLIELMVYSGWTVTEIRNVLKGESAALGQEIEATRQRLGLAPSVPYRTPIADRPTSAQFQDDPELEFQPPPR